MNLQQFRFLREAARQKFSLTAAARALHTSQPGISKAIIDLENELGVPILARHGKRVLGLTPPGQQVLSRPNASCRTSTTSRSWRATSPAARKERCASRPPTPRRVMCCPASMQQFAHKFPKVRLKMLESNPPQIAAMLVNGQADIGMATETLADCAGAADDSRLRLAACGDVMPRAMRWRSS